MNVQNESIRNALRREYCTIAWNVNEALVAIGAGWIAASIALVGFGLDSLIEVTSAAALVWRLRKRGNPDEELEAERTALRIVAYTFFALAAYITYQAGSILLRRAAPEESLVGIALAAVSLVVMPWLGFAKEEARPTAREPCARRRRHGNPGLLVSLADPPARSRCQRPLGLVVGGPAGGARHRCIRGTRREGTLGAQSWGGVRTLHDRGAYMMVATPTMQRPAPLQSKRSGMFPSKRHPHKSERTTKTPP